MEGFALDFTGQVALVTGGSRGIGRAIALALGSRGAAVVLTYRERRLEADRVVAEIAAAGGQALALPADFSAPGPDAQAQAEALVAACVANFRRLDILVHSAGVALDKLLLDTAVEEWDRLMAINLRAPYLLARAALSPMLQQQHGRIIAISSMWGLVGAAGEVAYSASKAGLIGLVRALAQEVGRAGITVNAVAPGAIETEMIAHLTPEDRAELADRTPVGRLGTPDEVAAAVLYLAGRDAGFITGQVLSPNGGLVT